MKSFQTEEQPLLPKRKANANKLKIFLRRTQQFSKTEFTESYTHLATQTWVRGNSHMSSTVGPVCCLTGNKSSVLDIASLSVAFQQTLSHKENARGLPQKVTQPSQHGVPSHWDWERATELEWKLLLFKSENPLRKPGFPWGRISHSRQSCREAACCSTQKRLLIPLYISYHVFNALPDWLPDWQPLDSSAGDSLAFFFFADSF